MDHPLFRRGVWEARRLLFDEIASTSKFRCASWDHFLSLAGYQSASSEPRRLMFDLDSNFSIGHLFDLLGRLDHPVKTTLNSN